MDRSKQIAGLVGPSLIAITASEALNLGIWAEGSPTLVYLNGTLLFVAGLAVIRVHNRWTRTWPVLVTLTGWGALLAGLFRMFVPYAPQAGESLATYAGIALLFAVGAFLAWKGFRGTCR